MRFSEAVEALLKDHSLAIWHMSWMDSPMRRFIVRNQWSEDPYSHVFEHWLYDFEAGEWSRSLGFFMPMWRECDSDRWEADVRRYCHGKDGARIRIDADHTALVNRLQFLKPVNLS